jgi:hypothetical protein
VHVDDKKKLKVKMRIFKNCFAESEKKTLGEEFLRRESVGWLSAKNSSPRVFLLLSAKNFFTESNFLRRELFFLLSAKSSSPRAQVLALTKEYYSRQRLRFP